MIKNCIKRIIENKRLLATLIILAIIFLIIIITCYIHALEKVFETKYNIFILIMPILMIICLLSFFTGYTVLFSRKNIKIENNGILFKEKDGTHGTANFTTADQIPGLSIGKEETTSGIILGRTINTNEIIILPDDFKEINRNIMIWGASGSRKVFWIYNTKFIKNCR